MVCAEALSQTADKGLRIFEQVPCTEVHTEGIDAYHLDAGENKDKCSHSHASEGH